MCSCGPSHNYTPQYFSPEKHSSVLKRTNPRFLLNVKFTLITLGNGNKLPKRLTPFLQKLLFFAIGHFLSPCWSSIAKHLNPKIKRIALVDNWKPHEPRPWDAWLNKKFEKQMDAFSCLSAIVKEEISSETMKPCWGKMHPIAENLPPKHKKDEARTTLGLEVDKQYLLFFGLIRPYKGLDLLLHALAEHPDKKLLIVGECYEAIEKYTRLIKQLGLEAQIELQNRFVTTKEAAQYFSAADALVLPYKSATQSGVVAMAYHYQLPMVVTNHPGLSHAIENDKTGIVCAPTAKKFHLH